MLILGLGGLLGDAACAALVDGEVVAAVEERKLTRGVNRGRLPEAAIAACLRMAGAAPGGVDCVAVARPFTTSLESLTYVALRHMFPAARVIVVEHHAAHAASAYYASPFADATVLTLDRAGDFRCGARWQAQGTALHIDQEWYYPDSVGRLYGAVTELLGFHARSEEHKVQWLSASGDDRFAGLFREVLDGEGRLEPAWFDRNRSGAGGFSARFYEALGLAGGGAVPEEMAAHVAAGLQRAVEERIGEMAGDAERLCLAGGVFFNALLIQALERSGRRVFVQPAAGNAGTALGAAMHAWHQSYRREERARMRGLLLGPEFDAETIKQVLDNCKLPYKFVSGSDELLGRAVELLGDHQIVAWMQGRMEFGPRALGNRSILASPLNPYSTENLNVFIKHREPFRKFAASVPVEAAAEYFETGENARSLATVGRVREAHRKTFESAILGRDLIRVHTVERDDNPLYHRLLLEAGRRTGLPVLYNTSFNLFGDPLVCSPRDAVRSFYSSGIDALFVGNFLMTK
jgi:carbamoyltransferase